MKLARSPLHGVLATAALATALLAGCAHTASSLSDEERQRILAEELARAAGASTVSTAPDRAARAAPRLAEIGEPTAPHPLDRRVTLIGADVPLGNVLSRFAAHAGLKLNIEREVNVATPVSAAVKDLSVREALTKRQ